MTTDIPKPIPSLRTIQRIVKALRDADVSEPWAPSTSDDPEDARHILDVTAAVIEVRAGRGGLSGLTRREAEWCAWLGRAAPGLEPWAIFRIARMMILAEAGVAGHSSVPATAFIAFAPWRNAAAAQRYAAAVRAGTIMPLYPDLFTEGDETEEAEG